MGLFGGKKTYVSSTLYNMSGELADRKNYLKTLVTSNQLAKNKPDMVTTLRDGYSAGPGMRMRSYFRWAENNYDSIGVPTGSLGGSVEIDLTIVAGQIPHGAGEQVRVQAGRIEPGDYSYWAEQWMFTNEPTLVDTDWTSDIDNTTGNITITFEDTTTETFTPVGFDKNGVYIYAYYFKLEAGFIEPLVTGSDVAMLVTDPFPARTGWTTISDTTTPSGTDTIQEIVYERTTYKGIDPLLDSAYSEKEIAHHFEKKDATSAVIQRYYRIDTQNIIHGPWSDTQLFIYRLGTGNTVLDALAQDEFNDGEYFPYIPVRLDNKFLSSTYKPEAYELAKKAYRKLSNKGDLDDIIASMAENEDLGDIDYAYIMQGVPLNTKEAEAKEYLYRYFDKCRGTQVGSLAELAAWQASQSVYELGSVNWEQWRLAQEISEDPLFGSTEPPEPGSPAVIASTAPTSSVHIKPNGTLDTDIDMKITWSNIHKTTGSGLGWVGAKKGQYHVQYESDITAFEDSVYIKGKFVKRGKNENTAFSVTWQEDDDSWSKLVVVGAVHTNTIYNGKSVVITSKEALEDTDESGFLVPIHYATFREMSMIASTQMAGSMTYIVFNSYKVVKKKWYQTGIFKIFLIIVIVVLTIVFPPFGATGAGILGSAAAVGLAVGLTGLIGVIVGALINAVAAMILTRILTEIATLVLGEKWGAIIGAILSTVAIAAGTGLSAGMNVSQIWGSMMSAGNIMNMTSSIGNGISGMVQAGIADTYGKIEELNKNYAAQSDAITKKYEEQFGYDSAELNPLQLTDVGSHNFFETEEVFLSRTLLTGSDIADMTLDMLTNFTEHTIGIRNPFGR